MNFQISYLYGRLPTVLAAAFIAVLAGAAVNVAQADAAPRVKSAWAMWSEGDESAYGVYAVSCDANRRGGRLVTQITVRSGSTTFGRAHVVTRRGARGCVKVSRVFSTNPKRWSTRAWVTVKVTNPTTGQSSARRVLMRPVRM